ncbi:hypothetical protein [Nocardioides sp. GXZ039]|uniref:hypothetical protein n=1 Tax=Nocardioides sp. GXZ039 TaxID=3136018 RepID=UPI0030F4492A
MRTTVTLDPDTESLVRRLMEERQVSFKQALNDAIREGAAPRTRRTFTTRTHAMSRPRVDLDQALQLAGELEDDELIRRMRSGQ